MLNQKATFATAASILNRAGAVARSAVFMPLGRRLTAAFCTFLPNGTARPCVYNSGIADSQFDRGNACFYRRRTVPGRAEPGKFTLSRAKVAVTRYRACQRCGDEAL